MRDAAEITGESITVKAEEESQAHVQAAEGGVVQPTALRSRPVGTHVLVIEMAKS
jgi:hypothetical protein